MLNRLIAATLLAVASLNVNAISIDLGDASGYNFFVKDSFLIDRASSNATVAAGGTITNTQNTSHIPSNYHSINPATMANSFQDLAALSTTLNRMASTGTLNNAYGTLTLNSTAVNGLHIVDYNLYTSGSSVWNVNFNGMSATDILVLNIGGTDINTNSINFSGAPMNNILFNFYEAQNLSITNGNYSGTYLAPNANVTLGNATFSGQLIANSFAGTNVSIGAANNLFPGYNFNEGGATDPVEVPESATWVLALLGLISLIVLRRRRIEAPTPAYTQTQAA